MASTPSRENLPHGWDIGRWDYAKRATRAVIWRVGLAGETISYHDLGTEVELHARSPVLHGLLVEIAADERAKGGPWVTAVVVGSVYKYPGPGFFEVVPDRYWGSLGKTAFSKQQRALSKEWMRQHPVG